MAAKLKTTRLDRALLQVAPQWALSRIRARAAAQMLMRHFDAAASGRRTENWPRSNADANVASAASLTALRAIAHDMVRNNTWAKRGLQALTNNTVGWGFEPKASGGAAASERFREAWKQWAETTECDADARLSFFGLQRQVMRTVAESGEVLIRRRIRRPTDGLAIPLQLQILEPDFIDMSHDVPVGQSGGPIINGVEFDAIGRRTAYWLFSTHPGSGYLGTYQSKRIPASEILHVFEMCRPGQVRGPSWFAPIIVKLRDYYEYDDATLMRQKIAACFAGFVTDVDGTDASIGEASTTDELVDTLEPGMVKKLRPGQEITFGTPPLVSDHESYSAVTLRAVAQGLGVTYEDLTGDYSKVNFSSSRMARIAHWANVHDWRWNMLMPQFCDPAWAWVMAAAEFEGIVPAGEVSSRATWTPPPMAMLEPDREGLALQRLVRTGAMTPDEMVRQQGEDPESHWAEYAANLKRLDALGIVLDSDARKVSQAGLTQERVGGKSGKSADKPAEAV
jgi:lambda family phage portal protein